MAALSFPTGAGSAAVPHPVFRLLYGKKEITADVTPFLRSVRYADYLSGQSDEIDVELEDADGRWMAAWYPGKGDDLSLSIGYADAPLKECGLFEIDEITVAGPPSVVTIRALATGVTRSQRTRVGKVYEETSLAGIVRTVAKRNKLEVKGKIPDVTIDRATQYQERDLEFLHRLAREYGAAFKVIGATLVFHDMTDLRDAAPVATFRPSDLTRFNLSDKIREVFKRGSASYHDPDSGELVESAADETGEAGGDELKINTRTKTTAQAKRRAESSLEEANRQRTGGSLSMMGNPKLWAGGIIQLSGFGKLSGAYLIESARHSIDRGSGYMTELEIKRVKA